MLDSFFDAGFLYEECDLSSLVLSIKWLSFDRETTIFTQLYAEDIQVLSHIFFDC